MKREIKLNEKEVTLRLLEKTDIDEYYKSGFDPIDDEVKFYTGTTHTPSKETITSYINKVVSDESRYDFLILNSNHDIIGESIISEIDPTNTSASFRISLFNKKNFGKGIGSKAINMTLQFGFCDLNLHRIGLEVFTFNERAYKAYKRAGFVKEGILREAVFINDKYHDVINMGILKDEYLK